MINNKIKLSLVAAMMTATCGFAGTVTAPNSMDIELSGDVELKAVSEKKGSETINQRTAEVNLALEAKLDNGINVITEFKVFDGSQAQTTDAPAGEENGKDDGFKVTQAYANIPIMGGKGKVIAGLAPNLQYGTEVFENDDESWKIGVNVPVANGVKATLVSKIENEEEADKDKGDSGMTAFRVDAKVADLMVGAKYGIGYENKDDGFTAANSDDNEKEIQMLTAYVAGEVAGLDVGFEYMQKDVDLIGTTTTMKPKGYFATVGKEFGDLSVGLAYVNLTKGMKGGDDFAPGMILDGNVNSSSDKDTSAFVVPIEYAISDQVTASATFINADVLGEDITEIDLGATYAMDDNVELSVGYGHVSGTVGDDFDDNRNLEVAIAITF